MQGLSRAAKVYVLGVIGLAAALVLVQIPSLLSWRDDPWLFLFLLLGAITAQFFTVVTPKHQHYYLTPAFFFPGIMLLGYGALALIIAAAHIVEWIKVRYPWYIQTFNIAGHIIAGYAAKTLLFWLLPRGEAQLLTLTGVFAVFLAGVLYTVLNHLMVGLVLRLARNVSLKDSQVLSAANLLTDLGLISAGASIGYLWIVQPWMVLLGTAPLVLIHRALSIPTLREEAQVDAKTGLYNAKYFGEIMEEELRRARRFSRPLAVVMSDLDGLRYINNTYGHLAGDAVLTAVGEIIRTSVREYDVAARFGGEEFVLLMPETTTHEGYVVAERIRKAVETTPIAIPTHVDTVYITITSGIASYPADGSEANELIHAADVALYQGKAAGKNRVRMSAPGETADLAAQPVAMTEPVGISPSPERVAELAAPASRRAQPAEERTHVGRRHQPPPPQLLAYVAAVAIVGAFLMAMYLPSIQKFDAEGLVILIAFALVAELLSVDLYGAGTVSVSFAAIFAAALLYGPTGVSALAPAIAIGHWIKRRPRAYQVIFNASNHMISSTAAAIAFALFGVQLRLDNLLLLIVPTAAAATVNYLLSTFLLAVAIGASERFSPARVWREQFRWLGVHYLVMGGLAMFFVLAYVAFGIWGVVVFVAPLLILRYAQKQYVDQTAQSVAALRKVNEELAHANQQINMINDDLLVTLASTIDARDPYVYGHSTRVADYATAIGRELNMRPDRIELIRRAALLHDVGKIGLPESVLKKEGELSSAEFEIMKQHPDAAVEILSACHQLQNLVPIVQAHHERWDGTGYPKGLKGDEIPLEARVLAVADAVEAMAFERTYHRSRHIDEILREVEAQSGRQFDPKVAAALMRLLRQSGPEFLGRQRNAGEPAAQDLGYSTRPSRGAVSFGSD